MFNASLELIVDEISQKAHACAVHLIFHLQETVLFVSFTAFADVNVFLRLEKCVVYSRAQRGLLDTED